MSSMTSLGGPLTSGLASERLSSLHESVRGAASSTGLHTVGRNLAETASEHAEHLDFFSENSIGACVTCCISLVIWLVFLPIFHLGAVPWMEGWEAMHSLTVSEYMQHAEETFATPRGAFEVLDSDADHNSTMDEFRAGSDIFKRPPFRYPADMYPIFLKIDANKDGVIEDTEFFHATPSGMSQKWHINMTDLKTRAKESYGFLDSYYTAMDINSDGKVNLQEFVAMAATLEPPVPAEDAKALFLKADTDGMGAIEPREWVAYNVTGNFTFQASLAPGILPTGPRVMMAVEAGLRTSLQVLQFDLLTITGVEDVTGSSGVKPSAVETVGGDKQPTTTAPPRILSVNANNVNLRVTFVVLTGTRSRQNVMQTQVNSMPNNVFMGGFANSISGGSTTLPVGPVTTAAPQKPGPVSDKDLEAYVNVPAIIQGHTELHLSHAKVGVHEVSTQEAKLKPLFKSSFDTFCKCSLRVESVQSDEVQDETGAGLATNKTMVISWSIDLRHGGKFERAVKDNGHELVHSIYANIMQANLPCMVGVSLDSWTTFSATYYGSSAATLPRGPALQQLFGHHVSLTKGLRNDTGTPPFVESTTAQ